MNTSTSTANSQSTSVRVAIVTGGSRGIGAAIAIRLAGDGHQVVVNYRSSPGEAAAVVGTIERAGGTAIAVQGDVADPAQVDALFSAATKAFGGVDVVVQSAGFLDMSPIAELTDSDIEQAFAVNAIGSLYGMRAAARSIRDGGRVVNLSSTTIGLKMPGYGLYSATKAAVEALTHVLAKELGGRGITVNAVAPGPVATELLLDGRPDDSVRQLEQMHPAGRLGTPEDVAAVVSFLAKPEAGWVNGQVLRVNNGIV